jgi:hypothetical protein
MKKKQSLYVCLKVTMILAVACVKATAQLPPDFPTLVISSNGPVAPGDFIGTMGWKGSATNTYEVVLNNSASPLFCNETQVLWRVITPCGLIAEKGNTSWLLKDESFTVTNSYPVGNGYGLDGHDFKLLSNGHALILANESRPMDMSQYIQGGRPDAVLSSLVFQEIDANKQIVFQWRALDHLAITDSLDYLNVASVDWTHVNAIAIDPRDNNYLVSLRGFCQIAKISRTTGDVIWRLGGKSNSFTFIGEHPENAPYYFIGQHNIHGLANGDIMFFDNGSLQGQGDLPGRTYSRAVQYHLDETNMTATLVWEYRHTPDVLTPTEGIVKRFANGNSYVGWVSAAQQGTGPVFTEVNASNQVVFELSIPGYQAQSIMSKQLWNTPDLVHSVTNQGIVAGQVYNATNAGIAVTVNSLSGSSGNTLIVSKHDDAVRLPQFAGPAPQVLVQRVTLTGTNIDTLAVDLSFDLPPNDYSFDTPLYVNPSDLTIYQRATVGHGSFTPLPTVYDAVAGKLKVSITQLGEFIFAYPDHPEILLAPILFGPATQASVSQAEPVMFQWTPKGFAGSYHLQVATDSGFSSLVMDQASLTNMAYTLSNLLAGTSYYWRVNVSNSGGTSDWSTASFAAAPPVVQVTSPKGGEAWQRGLPQFITWSNNFAENVAIDLYRTGTRIARLNANAANIGAYSWSISVTNVPSSDYTIRISSATNATVFGASALPFSIVDAPNITARSVARLPDGGVQFALTAPGAATASVLDSTNLSTWEVLQVLAITNGAAVFTDDSATNYPTRFYRLRLP